MASATCWHRDRYWDTLLGFAWNRALACPQKQAVGALPSCMPCLTRMTVSACALCRVRTMPKTWPAWRRQTRAKTRSAMWTAAGGKFCRLPSRQAAKSQLYACYEPLQKADKSGFTVAACCMPTGRHAPFMGTALLQGFADGDTFSHGSTAGDLPVKFQVADRLVLLCCRCLQTQTTSMPSWTRSRLASPPGRRSTPPPSGMLTGLRAHLPCSPPSCGCSCYTGILCVPRIKVQHPHICSCSVCTSRAVAAAAIGPQACLRPQRALHS